MGKDKKQTVTQRLDPKSQGFVDQMRYQAQAGANTALGQPGSFFEGAPDISSVLGYVNEFLNPYTQQVIGGVNQQFDQLRAGATRSANEAAARAGSFGGARHGVAEGTAHGELGRAQAQTVGGLLSSQFNQALGQGLQFSEYQRALRERQLQEPLFRAQTAQSFYRGGLGPTGMDQTTTQPGSLLKDIAGAGLTIGGALLGGPQGAAAANQFTGGGGFTPPSFFPETNFNPYSRWGR